MDASKMAATTAPSNNILAPVTTELIHFARAPGPQPHGTTLVVSTSEITFAPKPSAKDCKLPAVAVPLDHIEIAEVGHKAAGQVFLHLKYRDGYNGKSHD